MYFFINIIKFHREKKTSYNKKKNKKKKRERNCDWTSGYTVVDKDGDVGCSREPAEATFKVDPLKTEAPLTSFTIVQQLY